jgi:peptidylprolyl isomerase
MRKILLGFGLLLAACSSPDSQQAIDSDAPETGSAAATEECDDRTPAAPAKEDSVEDTKPDVEVPDGAPPCELVIQDIVKGSGAEAEEGATVTVHYVGVSWSTGEQFDASWDGAGPATFPLSGVIPGWQEGIPGMNEGGRRQLIIPPDLAYGAQGRPGIAPNETLVFVIDLLEIEQA